MPSGGCTGPWEWCIISCPRFSLEGTAEGPLLCMESCKFNGSFSTCGRLISGSTCSLC
uniref:Uncharacterized protein n=1 Tax=Arundo donax TaxID=35708 RepID=A0A0A9ERR1_ARUDO